MRSHQLPFLSLPIVLLILVVLSMMMVACSGTTDSGSTPVQNCGQLHSLNGHFMESGDSVRQAENCFLQAFQKCSAAMLSFEASGIDAGIIHAFTIMKNNGTCSISDAIRHYIAPNPPEAGNAYTCTGLTEQADGLHFSGCGDEGIVIVPAPSAQQCGVVETRANTVQDEAGAKQAEKCFWQAFQLCIPVVLVFRMYGVDTVLTRTFTIKKDSSTCSISDSVQNVGIPPRPSPIQTYSCTNVTQQEDGLHFSACGQDGDVTVPV